MAAGTTRGRPVKGSPAVPSHREPETVGQLAEAAVLGAAMWSAEAARGAVEHLTPDMFTRNGHRAVFEAIVALVAAGAPVDTITVHDQVCAAGRADEVGGPAATFELATLEMCPTVAGWNYYATIVRREHDRTTTIRRLRKAIERLEAGEEPATVRADIEVAA